MRIYNENSNVAEFIQYEQDGSVWGISKFFYDDKNRMIEMQYYHNVETDNQTEKYSYDENGNNTLIEYFDYEGNLTDKVIRIFDPENNLIKIENYSEQFESLFSYSEHEYDPDDNSMISVTYIRDEFDRMTIEYMNKEGNTTLTEEYNAEETLVSKTFEEYNADGKLISSKTYDISDSLIRKTIYECDDDGNLINKISYDYPDNKVELFIYEREEE